MPIPAIFTEATDWYPLAEAIRPFGDAAGVTEDDLLAALGVIEMWRERFTDALTFKHEGKQITHYRYESLIWDLGVAFEIAMQRNRRLRRCERIFEAVQAVCLDRRFGKGRESFTMFVLGRYGGPAQIPTLIDLLDDPQVSGHAVHALRLLGATEAADKVRPFLAARRDWVREEARKYFKKIGQSANGKQKRVRKSATKLARALLERSDTGRLEELRIHEFADDEEGHDDDATARLYEEFSAEFDRVVRALSRKYGKPSRTGKEDDEVIPLNGVFRFAVWSVGGKQLFAAAAHEDRGVPILLMLGTADSDVASNFTPSPTTS